MAIELISRRSSFLNLIWFWFWAAADTRLIPMAASSTVELLFIEM